MPAIINITFEEKKWLKIDLKKISKKAFRSTFKILKNSKNFNSLEVSILACNDQIIKNYNKKFRGNNKATNVLSWPRIENIYYNDIRLKKDISFLINKQESTLDIGDIAISYDTCFREAMKLNICFEEHVIHMLIHSCLHLLGFGHNKLSEFKIMKDLEIKSLKECGINNPYNQLL